MFNAQDEGEITCDTIKPSYKRSSEPVCRQPSIGIGGFFLIVHGDLNLGEKNGSETLCWEFVLCDN